MGFLGELGRGLVKDLLVGPTDNLGQQKKEPGVVSEAVAGAREAVVEATRPLAKSVTSDLIRDLTRPWGSSEEKEAQEAQPATSPSRKKTSPKTKRPSRPSDAARTLSLSNQLALPASEQAQERDTNYDSSNPGDFDEGKGNGLGKLILGLAGFAAKGVIGAARTAGNAARTLKDRRVSRNISPYETEQANDPDAGPIIDAEWTVK